jgi:hypothetical protein
MGFQAADAVVALDWDLRPYVDAHGTVPEPSQAKLDAYAKAMLGVFAEMGLDLPATASEEDIEQALTRHLAEGKTITELGPEVQRMHEAIRKRRIAAASKVCGGSPTVAQITQLPPRVREAFLGWVAGFAADPTLPQPATSPSLATSRNGASAT